MVLKSKHRHNTLIRNPCFNTSITGNLSGFDFAIALVITRATSGL